jgi:hypothetical protein
MSELEKKRMVEEYLQQARRVKNCILKQRQLLESIGNHTIFEHDSVAEMGSVKSSMVGGNFPDASMLHSQS